MIFLSLAALVGTIEEHDLYEKTTKYRAFYTSTYDRFRSTGNTVHAVYEQ